VALALAGGLGYAESQATGTGQVILAGVALLAAAYGMYTVGIVLVTFALSRVLRKLDLEGVEALQGRWPIWARAVVTVLVVSWPGVAWLSGYDGSEWIWSGVSTAFAVLAVGLLTRRRKQSPRADASGTPRHRSLE
jgi:amino acid transporter